MRIVECYTRGSVVPDAIEEPLHLVKAERDLHALCGHDVASLTMLKESDFGHPAFGVWCAECLRKLKRIELPDVDAAKKAWAKKKAARAAG
jgi:hypothetical protein